MKEKKHIGIVLIGLLALVSLTQEVKAMPMFTKQTGMDCMGCHVQQMPRLNKFGRKFAASGMTISQHVDELHSKEASFASNMDLNPSFLIKSKYDKTYDKPDGQGAIPDDGTNEGHVSAVRMAGVYLGGRVSENVGAILKLGHREEEGESIEGKAVYVSEVSEDAYLGAVFFSTGSLGPFSGMEFYNTGLYKPLRMFDMKTYNNTVQKQKIGSKAATGIQIYYDRDTFFNEMDHFFVTAGMYAPAQDNAFIDVGDNLIPFARVAYEYVYKDFNLIFGAFIMSGGDKVAPTDALSIKRNTYGIDFQMEGSIMDKEMTLAATNVFKNDVEFTGIGAGLEDDSESMYDEGFSVQGAVSLTDEFIAKASYMRYNDKNQYRKDNLNDTLSPAKTTKINVKDLDYAIGLGLDYGFTLGVPMKLAVEYAWMKPTLDRVENYQDFMVTLTLPL